MDIHVLVGHCDIRGPQGRAPQKSLGQRSAEEGESVPAAGANWALLDLQPGQGPQRHREKGRGYCRSPSPQGPDQVSGTQPHPVVQCPQLYPASRMAV